MRKDLITHNEKINIETIKDSNYYCYWFLKY